jgi:hypothetical protein
VYERLTAIRRTLSDAPAFLLVERLSDHLAKEYGVTEAELYLVDYRLGSLVPLRGGDPLTHPGSACWRCFDQSRHHLFCQGPRTIRGADHLYEILKDSRRT